MPARSKPFIVCPAFEEGRAREVLAAGPFGKDADVLTWQEDESPFTTLGKGLRDRGLTSATVGLDENMKFVFADGIRAANPHLNDRQRDARHRGLPHDQGRARARMHAPRQPRHAAGLPRRGAVCSSPA